MTFRNTLNSTTNRSDLTKPVGLIYPSISKLKSNQLKPSSLYAKPNSSKPRQIINFDESKSKNLDQNSKKLDEAVNNVWKKISQKFTDCHKEQQDIESNNQGETATKTSFPMCPPAIPTQQQSLVNQYKIPKLSQRRVSSELHNPVDIKLHDSQPSNSKQQLGYVDGSVLETEVTKCLKNLLQKNIFGFKNGKMEQLKPKPKGKPKKDKEPDFTETKTQTKSKYKITTIKCIAALKTFLQDPEVDQGKLKLKASQMI